MQRCRNTHLLVVILLASLPLAASAQTPSPYSAAFTWTAGEGKGGDYVSRDLSGVRVGVSARHWYNSSVGVVAELAGESLMTDGSHTDICFPTASGTSCVERYPHFSGGTATLGLILSSSPYELRFSAGGGVYTKGTRTAALVGDADFVAYIGTHYGLVLGMRGILMPNYRGDQLSEVPITFGFRVR